jgi:hypothetical protein
VPSLLPPKPLPVRALNALGAALGARLPRLDPDRLLEAARRRTGLGDFGEPSFREGLERLVDGFEREAALTTLGRVVARRDLLRLLEGRLRLEAALRAEPAIERSEIRAPIFLLGLPRTGTSILHELLAQDPANRVPTSWEVMHPWPAPEAASFESDPRIAAVERQLAGVERLIPGFQAVHRMGATLPQECVAITAHEFASILFTTTHRVPAYQRWLESLDHRGLYRAHRRWLQYFQWRVPRERWVLKSPGHLWTLDALLAVHPDARIVQTHRDPLRVVASLVSLTALLRSLASDAVDPREIAREWAPRLAEGLDASMRARLRRLVPRLRGRRDRDDPPNLRALRHDPHERGRGAHAPLSRRAPEGRRAPLRLRRRRPRPRHRAATLRGVRRALRRRRRGELSQAGLVQASA